MADGDIYLVLLVDAAPEMTEPLGMAIDDSTGRLAIDSASPVWLVIQADASSLAIDPTNTGLVIDA